MVMMEDKGYSGKYIPPQDNCAVMQELFSNIQERCYCFYIER